MNAERLLQLYDRVSEAPDAIPRLRRSILDLAVRGKLVEQDLTDEPASELLKRIAVHRQELVQAGEAKAQKHVPAATRQDLSFDLPSTWEPARLADVTVCLDYMRRPINGSERAKRIEGKSETELYPYYGATQQQGWIDDYIFDDELVLLGEDGVPFFDPMRAKAYLISGKSWVNNHAHVFKGLLISSPFLVQYLNVFDYTGRVVGATRSKLNQARAIDIPIPVPPVAEQHRIVAKVDELMALGESLEAEREKREVTRDRLTTASLSRLTAQGVDENHFKAYADFAIKVLPELTTRPDQIKVLRQTILDLAVRGKLVEQDPNDEPASELIAQLAANKAQLVKDGEIKRDAPPTLLAKNECPFDVPAGWVWTRLGNLIKFVTSGSRDWAKHYSTEGAIFLRMGNLSRGHYLLRLDQVQRVKPPADGEGTRTRLEGGDILISITGDVGMLGLIPEGFGEAYINQHTAMVRPMPQLTSRYLPELFRSPLAQAQFNEPQRGIKNSFRLTDVTQLIVPVPPLTEQHRIVAKVDELMLLCDHLEQHMVSVEEIKDRVLDVLVVEALALAPALSGAA